MFCPKCGKEIDDNATFCGFCGTPLKSEINEVSVGAPQTVPQPTVSQMTAPQAAVPQPTAPQMTAPQAAIPQPTAPQMTAPQAAVPQPTAPQMTAPQAAVPQPTAPQMTAPQAPIFQQTTPQGVTQFGAPQATPSAGFNLNLAPKTIDLINKVIRGALVLLSLLILIGSIGTMASAGSVVSVFSGNTAAAELGAKSLIPFMNLARVPAIIAFSLSVLGLVFTILTKQKSLFSYVCAGVGVIMFVFNFVMYGGALSFGTSLYSSAFSAMLGVADTPSIGGIVVGGIFLIICAVAMAVASLVILLNKESIVKFRPKY